MDIKLESVINMLEDIAQGVHELDTEHGKRVAEIAVQIGKRINGGYRLTADKIKLLGYAARIHDLGRIGIDNSIISKAGKLTQSQRAAMQAHSNIGYNFLAKSALPPEITLTVKYHHEHWDGTGYPDKLTGLDIPLYSRIVTIADSFDAISSKRPYHNARSRDEALSEMNKCVTWFDPYLYGIFLDVLHDEVYGNE